MNPFLCHLFVAVAFTFTLQTIASTPKYYLKAVIEVEANQLQKIFIPLLKGYEYFPDFGYYKFYTEGVHSFNDAKIACEKDGAHLAILNSKKEAALLKSMYDKHPDLYHHAYVGFHDELEEGKYITVLGDPLHKTGYSKWSPGEPNQAGGNEDCGSISSEGTLNDLHCVMEDRKVPFFCEF